MAISNNELDRRYASLASAIVVKAMEDTVAAIRGRKPVGCECMKDFDFEGEIQSNYRFLKVIFLNF